MKNKGFTLIELLAVILILAIISLIAVPVIGNIINDVKENAFKSSVTALTSTIEEKCQVEMIKSEAYTKNYTIRDGVIIPKVDIKGKIPDNGDIKVDDECNVIYDNLTDWTYVAVKTKTTEINITKHQLDRNLYENGRVVYLNPITLKTCTDYHIDNSMTEYNGITSGTDSKKTTDNQTSCLKWYAFNDEENATSLNLILDHNTSSITTYNKDGVTNTAYGVEISGRLDKLSSNWGVVARLITANEIANIIDKTWDYAVDTSKFYFDSKDITPSATCTTDNLTGCNYGWLYDRTSLTCESTGCNNNSNVETLGYWTSSPHIAHPNSVWGVLYEGKIDHNYITNRVVFGIRPVITVLKSSIN